MRIGKNMIYVLADILRLTGHSSDSMTVLAASIGLLLPLQADRPFPAPRNLQWHVNRLQAAVGNDQLRICFDRFGRYCGHVQWTGTTPETESRLMQSGPDALDAEHLIRGANAWILDLSASGGILPDMLAALRDDWLAGQQTIAYFRYKNRRCIAKRLARSSPASFFRAAPTVPEAPAQAILTRGDGSGLLHSCTAVIDAAIEAGHFYMLMAGVAELAGLPLQAAVYRLRVPLGQYQRRLYRDADGAPAGFLTWAWLDQGAIAPKPVFALHAFEWNEGDLLCLMDGVATPAAAEEMRADLAHAWFGGEPLSIYGRWETAQPGQLRLYGAQERPALAAMLAGIDQPVDIAAMLARAGS